jgi:precorrin-4/cobalt-precorrin-4 C11-methyltransferase
MISFVGAGPGAPDLITLRGRDRLAAADVVVWASSLVPRELLTHARAGAHVHDSASMTLEDVLAVYADHADDAAIVRLHSGDPSLYGAVREQVDWCESNGRSYEIVPGVSSMAAAAAALGRELTVPQVSQSVVIPLLAGRTLASMPAREGVQEFAAHGATLAVFLSGARPAQLQRDLIDGGYHRSTPCAVCVRVSWPDEEVIRTTVGELAATMDATGATRTMLVLVGDVLGDAPVARSHLYAPEFAHTFRRRSVPGSTAGRPA